MYTLVSDLNKVKEKKHVVRVLKLNLNKDLISRMTSYDYQQSDEKAFITASVNTVKFIDIQKELKLEKELT